MNYDADLNSGGQKIHSTIFRCPLFIVFSCIRNIYLGVSLLFPMHGHYSWSPFDCARAFSLALVLLLALLLFRLQHRCLFPLVLTSEKFSCTLCLHTKWKTENFTLILMLLRYDCAYGYIRGGPTSLDAYMAQQTLLQQPTTTAAAAAAVTANSRRGCSARINYSTFWQIAYFHFNVNNVNYKRAGIPNTIN